MNEEMGDGLGPEPCQPIGCDAGFHLPGCIFEEKRMKLYVTVGYTNGSEEHTFEIPDGEYATYIGLEIDAIDKESKTGRAAILRTPFHSHGITIHTICDWPSEVIAVIEREAE